MPFFAMEYLLGEPIDVYCDRLELSIRARLELFGKVCQNLVIHRDLEPANILVTPEGEPEPVRSQCHCHWSAQRHWLLRV